MNDIDKEASNKIVNLEAYRCVDWSKIRDVVRRVKPEILVFDMKLLPPKQMEALFRLIDDDPDLAHGWSNGPVGTAIMVASYSMMSAMPPDQLEQHQINLTMRV